GPVLDDRLVDQGQHFRGLRLGGRKKPGTKARGGEDGFSYGRHGGILTYNWPMLDPSYIRDHAEEVRKGLGNRGLDPNKALEEIVTLETARRRMIPELEGLKRAQNTSGDEIARAKRQGLDTAPVQEVNRARAQQIKQLDLQLDSIEHQRNEALLTLPNLPHASVPVGRTAA